MAIGQEILAGVGLCTIVGAVPLVTGWFIWVHQSIKILEKRTDRSRDEIIELKCRRPTPEAANV